MKYYLNSIEETLKDTGSSLQGLTQAEAERRLSQNGKNKLAEGKKESLAHMFLRQLADPMIIILIVAAAVSAVISYTFPPRPGPTKRSAPARRWSSSSAPRACWTRR